MLRVLGGPKRMCDGMTRRDLLRLGGLGLLGATAPRVALAGESATFGRAKACILLYLYGAASQIETFDPKPDAPAEIRGEFGSIPSAVPGLRVCEGLPRLARVMDKVSVIRSVTHPYPNHGVAFSLTGAPTMELAKELIPRDAFHLTDRQSRPLALVPGGEVLGELL